MATTGRQLKKLSAKPYRDSYVRQHMTQGLAFQIKAMRESRGWTQAELARRLGVASQSTVARLEDPAYGGISLSTLSKLASVFDVATLVQLVSFKTFLAATEDVTPQAIAPRSFSEEDLKQEEVSPRYVKGDVSIRTKPSRISKARKA